MHDVGSAIKFRKSSGPASGRRDFLKDILQLWYSGRPAHATAENYLLQACKGDQPIANLLQAGLAIQLNSSDICHGKGIVRV